MTLMDNFKKVPNIIFLVEITAEDLVLRFATEDVDVPYVSTSIMISSVSSLTLNGNYGELANIHVTGNADISGDYNKLENVEIDGNLTINATADSTELKGVTVHGLYSNYGSNTTRTYINNDPKHFDGIILGNISVRNYFDWNSFRYSASSVSLQLINKDRLQDYEMLRRIDNATAVIWAWSEGIGWNELEGYPIFQGVVRKKGYNNLYYEIDILDFAAVNSDGLDSLTISAQHPADTIYGILLSHTNIDIYRIDIASIATMKAILPGLEMATSVDTWVESFDLIDRLLGQCMCARHQKWGKTSIVSFDINAPALWHIVPSEINGETVNIEFTAFEKITNKLNVSYGPSGGTWGSTMTKDWTNNSKCKESYLSYGVLSGVDLKLTDCATLANANYCIERYLDFFAERHEIVELDLPYSIAFEMQCGDVGELTIEEGASTNKDPIRATNNLITNGSFEIGDPPSSWAADNDADLDRHADPNTGTYCLEINENGTANPLCAQVVTVESKTDYQVTFYLKQGTANGWRVHVWDIDNSSILATMDETSDGAAPASYAQYSLTFTTPSNCTSVSVYLTHNATAGAGTTILFDDVELYKLKFKTGWTAERCMLYEKSYLSTHINTKWWRID